MAVEELQKIFQVIQGGASKELGQIIQFPVNAAGASAAGKLAGEGVKEVIQMGNGAATTVSQLTTTAAGATTATATGLAVLSMPVTGATIAVASALGLVGGVGTGMWLYNLSPEFWADLTDKLNAAGQMVGTQLRLFLNCNGPNAIAGLGEPTIELIKQALLNEGLFEPEAELPEKPTTSVTITSLIDSVALLQYACTLNETQLGKNLVVTSEHLAQINTLMTEIGRAHV